MGNASCLFSKRVIPGFLFSKLFDDPMQHFKTDPTWVDPYTDEEIENILVVMIKELGNTDYITKTLSARKLQMSLRYMLIGFSLLGLFSHRFAAAPTGYGYNKYNTGGEGGNNGYNPYHQTTTKPAHSTHENSSNDPNQLIDTLHWLMLVTTFLSFNIKWMVKGRVIFSACCCMKRPTQKLRMVKFPFNGKTETAFGRAFGKQSSSRYWKKKFYDIVHNLREQEPRPMVQMNPFIMQGSINSFDPLALAEATWEWRRKMLNFRRSAVYFYKIAEIGTILLAILMILVGGWNKNTPAVMTGIVKLLAAGELFMSISIGYAKRLQLEVYDLEIGYDIDEKNFGIIQAFELTETCPCECPDKWEPPSQYFNPTWHKFEKVTKEEFNKAMTAKLRAQGYFEQDEDVIPKTYQKCHERKRDIQQQVHQRKVFLTENQQRNIAKKKPLLGNDYLPVGNPRLEYKHQSYCNGTCNNRCNGEQ